MTFDMIVMMICSSDDEFGYWLYWLCWHYRFFRLFESRDLQL